MVLYAFEHYPREPRPRRRMDAASDGNSRTMKTGGVERVSFKRLR